MICGGRWARVSIDVIAASLLIYADEKEKVDPGRLDLQGGGKDKNRKGNFY